MKKVFLLLGIVGLLTAFSFSTNTVVKKEFEGVITYSINYIYVPPIYRGIESDLPPIMKMFVKGEKVRMEEKMGGDGGSTISIFDNSTKQEFFLTEIYGQKVALRFSKQQKLEMNKDIKPSEVTYYKKDRINILGYKCKKAIVYNPNDDTSSEVYYTSALNNMSMVYKSLPGMPLEYIEYRDKLKLKMTASSISEESISDSLFEIPKEYKIVTQKQLQKMMTKIGG